MSRSTYVWVVTRQGGPPIAAVTVKHELSWWLDHQSNVEDLDICRIKDSRFYPDEPIVWLDPVTLEPIEEET